MRIALLQNTLLINPPNQSLSLYIINNSFLVSFTTVLSNYISLYLFEVFFISLKIDLFFSCIFVITRSISECVEGMFAFGYSSTYISGRFSLRRIGFMKSATLCSCSTSMYESSSIHFITLFTPLYFRQK